MASDLIRREALFDAMREKEWQNWPPLDEIDAVIAKAPAVDAVEVVRCKDCVHFCPVIGKEYKGDCGELLGLISGVYADDYCSYGVRRKKKDAVE